MLGKKHLLFAVALSFFAVQSMIAGLEDNELIFALEVSDDEINEEMSLYTEQVKKSKSYLSDKDLEPQASLMIWFAIKEGNKVLFDRCIGFQKVQFIHVDEVSGATTLHRVMNVDNVPEKLRYYFMEKLLDREELKINAQDKYGNTVLHLAIEKSFPRVVKLLLEKGADISIANKKDITSQMLLSKVQKKWLGVYKVLKKKKK